MRTKDESDTGGGKHARGMRDKRAHRGAVRLKLRDCRPNFASSLKQESPKSNERLGQDLSARRRSNATVEVRLEAVRLANWGSAELGEFALWRATRLRACGARYGSDQVTAPIKLENRDWPDPALRVPR